jgi:ABC-type sugar transport system substrate-binding protein
MEVRRTRPTLLCTLAFVVLLTACSSSKTTSSSTPSSAAPAAATSAAAPATSAAAPASSAAAPSSAAPASTAAAPAASSAAGGAKPAFLATYPGTDPAEENIKRGALQAGTALNVTVVFRNPTTFDVAQQLNVTQSALSYPNLKGVGVVAADPNSLEGVMKTAKGKGLALVQAAGCTPQATAPICFDTHPPTLGESAASYLGPLLGGSGQVVIAQGTLGDVNDKARETGFEGYMKQHFPKISIVDVLYGCNDSDKTVSCAQDALTKYPNLKGYFANGGGVALGASVFAKAGKHVITGTLDDAPPTLAAVKAGTVAFTLVQPQVCMGYLMVYSMYLQSEKHEAATTKYFDLGSTYVDAKNVGTLAAAEQTTCDKLIDQWNTTVFKPAA